jgi:hypothetical protein
VNAEIFLEYIRMVFMRNLNERRSLEQFADEDAVLLMENCPNHVGEEVSTILHDSRVRIITWPSHTTHVFQELDLCLFGVLKRRGQYILPFDDDQTTADFFFKIYCTLRQTMTEPSIWGAFQEAGFEFDTSTEPYCLVLDEEKCQNTGECQEIWSRDFPLENLSTFLNLKLFTILVICRIISFGNKRQ